MNFRNRKTLTIVMVLALLVTALSSAVVSADSHDTVTYRVTVRNISRGQPLTPPIAATHQWGISMFQVGHLASPELEYIAEDGMNGPMSDLLNGSAKVTAVSGASAPLTPRGHVVGDFTDTVSFYIDGRPGDLFSMASMLICTNDGFTGLNSVRLPRFGVRAFPLVAYDAGTEDNTEMSEDIVDPCSLLGRVALDGDPNGNEDAAVNTEPAQAIQRHPGITGSGDLKPIVHGWRGPVAFVVIEKVDN